MEEYLGSGIPKLGFGLMRLPMLGREIDIEQVKKMVDLFLEKGFTYVDTAYVYHGGDSEVVARKALVSRYPRESFQLATKLPVWVVDKKEDMQKIVDVQLERTGAGYFDFYLLHSVDKSKLASLDRFGAWDFMQKLKDRGVIKHMGFSFHDKAEVLDKILSAHPEMEFVQLQINYVDWDNREVQSHKCYEVALKHNKPVTIMEPVKGGYLATLPPDAEAIFKAANPASTPASWAVRFAASLEGVVTVLSGMSSLAQMQDNTSFMERFTPLDEPERAAIQAVVSRLRGIPVIPCTGCRYCVDGCPQKISIPDLFTTYNDYTIYHNLATSKRKYGFQTSGNGKASACQQCGACESHCPQHLEVMNIMKDIAKVFE